MYVLGFKPAVLLLSIFVWWTSQDIAAAGGCYGTDAGNVHMCCLLYVNQF